MNDSPRDLMKNRFQSDGLTDFTQQEQLELLLYYSSSPKKDVPALAKKLLERFGSVTEVFDAPVEELISIKGMTMHIAVFMKMIPEISRKYMLTKTPDTDDFSDMNNIGRYLVNYYIGMNAETVVLVLLDAKNRMSDVVKIHEGSVNSTAVTIRKLVETALFKHAPKVVLAHNHPFGTTDPSRADVDLTFTVQQIFQLVGIEFLGHIVVAGDEFAFVGEIPKISFFQ